MRYILFLALSFLSCAGLIVFVDASSALSSDYNVLPRFVDVQLEGQDPALFIAQLMHRHQNYQRQAVVGVLIFAFSVPLWRAWYRKYSTSGPSSGQ